MYESILQINSDNNDLTIIIDLDNYEYYDFYISNIGAFQIDEIKCACPTYPNGVFPGASSLPNNKQRSLIQRFDNCIEFSKIMVDDCEVHYNEQYLTTTFFEKRQTGWSSSQTQKKEGKQHIGYFIDGLVYHVDDYHKVYDIIYGIIYYNLINTCPAFIKLLEEIKNAKIVILQSFNREQLIGIMYVLYTYFKISEQPKIISKNEK